MVDQSEEDKQPQSISGAVQVLYNIKIEESKCILRYLHIQKRSIPGMKKIGKLSNVLLIGIVSLFADMSTEMVYPLIPLYLTAALGATPAVVGIIEGIAESTASLLKAGSGYIGDRYHNKKTMAFFGYAASAVYKVILYLAGSWSGVLLARIVDRIGKGVRTAPRDALVAQSSRRENLGRSYGLHKMLDQLGSSGGAFLAFLFIAAGTGFQDAFLLSMIPAVLSLFVIPFIREEKTETVGKAVTSPFQMGIRLKLYLTVTFLFCLGNSSNAFLLLKAHDEGFSLTEVMLLYLVFNLSSAVLSIPSGRLSDRFSRSAILVPGYLIYGAVYIGFALTPDKIMFPFLFAAYGAYIAFISGAERAFIAESAPAEYKGTVFGIYGMLQGFGLLLSSVIAGFMWDIFGSSAPFWFDGTLGILSACLILFILNVPFRKAV